MHLLLGRGWYSLQCSPQERVEGWGGPPGASQSALQGSSFLGQQPKSRPLQAGMLGNTGEHRQPEKYLPPWAVGTLERPALWVSRVLLDGLFPGGKRELRILSSPPRKLNCGAFPSFPGAWGGSEEGGGCQVHMCTGQATGKECQGGGQGGARSSPPLLPFPEEPGSTHQRQSTHHKEARKWTCMQWCIYAHRLLQTKCACVCGSGGGDGATETPGLLSEALFQRVCLLLGL